MGKIIKDEHISFFVEKIETGELVFRDGELVRVGGPRSKKSIKRAGRITNKGYVQLMGTKDGKEVSATAHRVIWAFYNGVENLKPDMQINHKNGIKDDNRIENLELVTASANMKHAFLNGLKKPMIGVDNPDAKLSEREVLMIKVLLENGCFSDKEISAKFGVSSVNIRHIKSGKTWSHIKLASIARVDTK